MMDILAQTTANEAIVAGVVAGAGVLGAFGLTIKHISNRSVHLNGTKFAEKDVCEERHKNLDKTLERMEEKLDKICTKLYPD